MRAMKYIKKGTDRSRPELVELSAADATEAGYDECDSLSMAASEERSALTELTSRVRGQARDLAGIEARVQRIEASGDEGTPGALLSARAKRRHLINLLAVNRQLLTDTAERAVTLVKLDSDPDSPLVAAVQRESDVARALAIEEETPEESKVAK